MYSYSRRNQQPTFGGKTERVGAGGTVALNELQYAREQVMAACKRAGTLFAHWRRYVPDYNLGTCSACYNPRTKTPVDPNCPVCYGTGFEGGYSRPTIQYMIVQHSDRRLEATSSGFVRMLRMKSQSPYLPNIAVSDVIGEIKNIEGEFAVGDRYIVEDGLERIRFRLADQLMEPNIYDHLDPEPEVVSYEFETSRIPKNAKNPDIKYSIPFENPVWLARIGDR